MSTSYERTFHYSQALNGADKTHKVYTLKMVPTHPDPSKAESLFHAHYRSALVVEVLDIQATLTMPGHAADKTAAYGGVQIVGEGISISDAAALSRGGVLATAGGPGMSANLGDAVGINPVIKGVARDGVLPTVVVGLYSDWKADGSVLGVLTVSFRVKFSGESNATGFDVPLQKAA
jgi:hypothetical protein